MPLCTTPTLPAPHGVTTNMLVPTRQQLPPNRSSPPFKHALATSASPATAFPEQNLRPPRFHDRSIDHQVPREAYGRGGAGAQGISGASKVAPVSLALELCVAPFAVETVLRGLPGRAWCEIRNRSEARASFSGACNAKQPRRFLPRKPALSPSPANTAERHDGSITPRGSLI